MIDERPYCLVLSGGGAKGIYHIGVRRALKELGVPIVAYIGNSIGAIIAAFLAQGLDDELEELGEHIKLDSILDVRGEGAGSLAEEPQAVTRKMLDKIYRSFTEKGGLDTSPLRSTLERLIDEDAMRESGRDFGVTTVNVSDMRPMEIFLDEMEKGTLVDYLMASSALPGFVLPQIKGKKYVDGGFYDNIPYEMARKRGYRRIIVVDVSGAGINRRPHVEGTQTVSIKNSIDMGGILDFGRKFLDDFRTLGYLDTMRAFDRLAGWAYFIRPDEGLERDFRAWLDSREGPTAALAALRPLFPEKMRHDRRALMKLLDCAAAALGMERVAEYDYRSLAAALRERREAEESRVRAYLAAGSAAKSGPGSLPLNDLVFRAIKAKRFEGSPYYYSRIVGEAAPPRMKDVLERILYGFCPELPAGLRYFEFAADFMIPRG